eukprot:TRINITY_DN25629_c0_g1_i1.p2 TRINITY_DN25629_c0_g1~~TRINITY_DN25629_c0_g1_i1.p2  ORF type:complete len:107 (+),score=5.14 TRINITY_DN25629_c0_g1_i1:3549-3869(+)
MYRDTRTGGNSRRMKIRVLSTPHRKRFSSIAHFVFVLNSRRISSTFLICLTTSGSEAALETKRYRGVSRRSWDGPWRFGTPEEPLKSRFARLTAQKLWPELMTRPL